MLIERPLDVPFGMPSPEALQLATAIIRQRYVLPETMQHPQVRSECFRFAYLIQAYGLASTNSAPRHQDIKSIRMRVSNHWTTNSRLDMWRENKRSVRLVQTADENVLVEPVT
jgi:hypothetical protein